MIIDRIDGAIVHIECDDGCVRAFPIVCLPSGAREGDVLVDTPNGFRLDPKATACRAQAIEALLDTLLQSKKPTPKKVTRHRADLPPTRLSAREHPFSARRTSPRG